MESFNQYLMSEFKGSLRKVSKTDEENHFLDDHFADNYFMISLDEMAKRVLNPYFKGDQFSSADGLFIEKKNDNFIFYFFEFKNLDFSKKEDRQLSRFYLNRCIDKIKDCSNKTESCNDCDIVDSLNKFKKYLIDRKVCSLRSKPYDSLSLLYHGIDDYFKENDSFEVDKTLFSIKKVFYLVSLTSVEEYTSPNKSNNRGKQFKYFPFLKRIKPYHFDDVCFINNLTFMNLFSELCINND